jgi:phosphoribosylaminoimidazolecarboxamide formyltransferase/IMP cyclohydrolase
MHMNGMQQRALISVSDKTGLKTLARGLVELGFEIVSTGGTSRFLKEEGLRVIDVSEYTGFPEIMDGRVKTLHPRIHGAILGMPDHPEHAAAIREHGIIPFQLVVCNLYPFERTIAAANVTTDEAIEQIDIGGPSMVRSAAKNHAYVAVVTRPEQYDQVLEELRAGGLTLQTRRRLARAAFEMTATYDRAIANYFLAQEQPVEKFPKHLSLSFTKQSDLRYGENPHQSAAFYVETPTPAASIAGAQQLHGKELSYNNLLDLDAAFWIVREFEDPAAVVIKHTNPCGCAIGTTLPQAFTNAYAGDPVSAFGSILAFNRTLDAATAELLAEPGRFIEAIIAPGYDHQALEILRTRPKWKNNVRLLECPAMLHTQSPSLDYRRISGGLLVQDRDEQPDPVSENKVVTERAPTAEELRDLQFAWKVAKHVKSNAIVLAQAGMIVGVGAGQMSRVDSSMIAAHKANGRNEKLVIASDAFFPFRDGIDAAAKAGVTAAIQPGGSKNDDEVIQACNEHGIAMIFTGRRHFKH